MPTTLAGINDRAELARLERVFQRREAARLMADGVTLRDPARVDVRGELSAGIDCVIDVDVVFEGRVTLGEGVRIGSDCVIKDARIGDGVVIHAHTVIDGAIDRRGVRDRSVRAVPAGYRAEPSTLRSATSSKPRRRVWAPVRSRIISPISATRRPVPNCNIGAGTIMCNYDGFAKHETHLGHDVFIGSNSTLVAPIEIGDGGYVAAGSTVTTKVEAGELAVGRARQRNIGGWVPPAKRGKNTQ